MIQKVDEPVIVVFGPHPQLHRSCPLKINWKNRVYLTSQLGYHHCFRRGATLFHTFSVVADNLFFRLTLNTDNLLWHLSEVSDGLPA